MANRRNALNQPRLVGVRRTPMGTAVISPLEDAIASEMRRYGVSRSFVIATCVAYALGVDEQADYAKVPAVHRRKLRRVS
jgi:hypothetical protein